MTIKEFRAFLEGMDIKDQPTKEEWDRIKDKIDKLETLPFEKYTSNPDKWNYL